MIESETKVVKPRGKTRPIEERAVRIILGMSLGKLSSFVDALVKEDPQTATYLAQALTDLVGDEAE